MHVYVYCSYINSIHQFFFVILLIFFIVNCSVLPLCNSITNSRNLCENIKELQSGKGIIEINKDVVQDHKSSS